MFELSFPGRFFSKRTEGARVIPSKYTRYHIQHVTVVGMRLMVVWTYLAKTIYVCLVHEHCRWYEKNV